MRKGSPGTTWTGELMTRPKWHTCSLTVVKSLLSGTLLATLWAVAVTVLPPHRQSWVMTAVKFHATVESW
jgi:hypothetical protein